jgi:hypothetical protein
MLTIIMKRLSLYYISLYGPLSLLRPSAPLQPSILSTALCLLYCPFPFYSPLFPLKPSVPSTALCLLYSPLSSLWSSVPSMLVHPLYDPLTHSYRTLSPLWHSLPSTALCPLYPGLSPGRITAKQVELALLFRKMFFQTFFVKIPKLS